MRFSETVFKSESNGGSQVDFKFNFKISRIKIHLKQLLTNKYCKIKNSLFKLFIKISTDALFGNIFLFLEIFKNVLILYI